MPQYNEKKVLPYTTEQLYALVSNVHEYPRFLPWCAGIKILEENESDILTELEVGYKFLKESFRSRVYLTPTEMIEIKYETGPFKHLNNRWKFHAHEDGCMVYFHIDFEFKSRMLQMMVQGVFVEAVQKMMQAFEDRARALYGPGAQAAV